MAESSGLSHPTVQRSLSVSLPLIPASETGTIGSVPGRIVDELLADDHLTA